MAGETKEGDTWPGREGRAGEQEAAQTPELWSQGSHLQLIFLSQILRG